MRKSKRVPAEVRERAVRLVLEHRGEYETKWAAIRRSGLRSSAASKTGCSPETLRGWVRQAEIDAGSRPA